MVGPYAQLEQIRMTDDRQAKPGRHIILHAVVLYLIPTWTLGIFLPLLLGQLEAGLDRCSQVNLRHRSSLRILKLHFNDLRTVPLPLACPRVLSSITRGQENTARQGYGERRHIDGHRLYGDHNGLTWFELLRYLHIHGPILHPTGCVEPADQPGDHDDDDDIQ
jgi:hypothetical protein